MKFSIILLGAALYLLSPTKAGIATTSPFNKVTWNGGDTVKITWDEDGTVPLLGDIGITTVDLMAGGDSVQSKVVTIGQTQAIAKEIGYVVPKDVGPPGNFYFIKFTAGAYTSFSGTFSIENVNGNIPEFDPNNPNGKAPPAGATAAAIPSTPTAPNDPKSNANSASPSNPSSPTASASPVQSPLPSTLSGNAAANLLPSFAGIATAAVALTLTYLY